MLAFATNGALPTALLARYAEVKAALELDAGVFGLLVAGFMLGAAGSVSTPGAFLRRWGSRWVASCGTAWIAVALFVAGLGVAVGAPWLFMAGLILAGYGDAVVDVAQNAQGLRVQQAYGRSLLTSMHAGWSIGAASGGFVGTVVASAGVPLVIHLGIWGVLCTISMTLAARQFLPTRETGDGPAAESSRIGRHGVKLLIPLALLAVAGVAVEDVGNNWSAVFLTTERSLSASAAGVGITILLTAQFVGRIVGDRFIDRVGHKPAVISSLLLVIIGLLLLAWAPWIIVTLAGLVLAGLGCAITVPLAFASADALPGFKSHAGVTWVNWIMRAATITLTPAIGGITAVASLPIAVTAVSLIAGAALVMQLQASVHPHPQT